MLGWVESHTQVFHILGPPVSSLRYDTAVLLSPLPGSHSSDSEEEFESDPLPVTAGRWDNAAPASFVPAEGTVWSGKNVLVSRSGELFDLEAESGPVEGGEEGSVAWAIVESSLGARFRIRRSQLVDASRVGLSVGRFAAGEYVLVGGLGEEDVLAFWRMVWEVHVSVLVYLNRIREGGGSGGEGDPEGGAMGKRLTFPYWPLEEGQVLVIGPLEVEARRIRAMGEYGIRTELTVRHMLLKEKRRVVHMQYIRWPSGGPPESLSSLIQFMTSVEKVHKRKPSRPLLVQCATGTRASPVFAVAHAVFQALLGTQELLDSPSFASFPEDLASLFPIPELVAEVAMQRIGSFSRLGDYGCLYAVVAALAIHVFPVTVNEGGGQ